MKDPQEVQGIALHPGLAFAGDRAGLGMHGLNAGVDLGKGWTWVNRKCGVESLDGFSVCVCVCVCVCVQSSLFVPGRRHPPTKNTCAVAGEGQSGCRIRLRQAPRC